MLYTYQINLGLGMVIAFIVVAGTSLADLNSTDLDESIDLLMAREARLPIAEPILDEQLIGFEHISADRYPNYVRMMGLFPDGGPAMANLCRSILYDGHVEPELKMAMGLAISLETNSLYTVAHMRRLLGATERGRELAKAVEAQSAGHLSPADRLALSQAITLTHDVYGLDDADFRQLRLHFNEPQIVEISLVACFFSYFNRMVDAINIPLESWALSPASERIAAGSYAPPSARVGLLSNGEVAAVAERLDRASDGGSWDGVVIANSIRAMARSSDIRDAWARMGSVMGESHIGRVMQHYVSNEVSYRNDCYYCKTHQVRKLAHDGVSIEHIARTINSDAALTDKQRQAVHFARTVTLDSTSVTDEQFAALRETFTDLGALEVLHVAARFNFMNRFTASLGLPSEPVSIEIYDAVEQARRAEAR
jgi:uncharacterized peroxidase-related enzyme